MTVPLYAEVNVIPYSEITLEELMALPKLGLFGECDADLKVVRILKDTSIQEHRHCCEPLQVLEEM